MAGEAGQLAIDMRSRGVKPGTAWNKSSWWLERDLNPVSPNFKFSALTIRPRCLLNSD